MILRPVLAAFGHALPWAIAVAYFYAAPNHLSFGTQVMIWILFAMSLEIHSINTGRGDESSKVNGGT